MMELLSREQPAVDWAGYCALISDQQLVWEQRGDELNQSMIYLMNLKNENVKKDLHLAYSQGDNTSYPPNIESMARYLSTQYSNNKPAHQRGGKRGENGSVMTQKHGWHCRCTR